jgi:hypothetical protein
MGRGALPFLNQQVQILDEQRAKKDDGPICRLTASPEVGPGATVGTQQTGYPRVQALS